MHIALNNHLVASEVIAASKHPHWPWRTNLTADFIKATSITMASIDLGLARVSETDDEEEVTERVLLFQARI